MKVALILKDDARQEEDIQTQAIVFDVEDERVIGVQNETICSNDVNYLYIWAMCKRVNEVYLPEMRRHNWVSKSGVKIRSYEELSDNKLFQTFIF